MRIAYSNSETSHKANRLFETEIASSLGRIGVEWTESAAGSRIHRIVLPNDERAHDDRLPIEHLDDLSDYPAIEGIARGIESLLEGQEVKFDVATLDFSRCRGFQQRVLLAEYEIPRGYVSTYGRIAGHLGVPRGGRAVGRALASNPFPLVIPCHRAVRSNGALGGFRGGVKMKESLLRMEGVEFFPNGRVTMSKVYY